MRNLLSILLAVAFTLTPGACDEPVTTPETSAQRAEATASAQQSSSTTTSTVETTFPVKFTSPPQSCPDGPVVESIEWEGTQHNVVHYTYRDGQLVRFKFHDDFRADGIGQETGEEYRLIETDQQTFNDPGELPFTLSGPAHVQVLSRDGQVKVAQLRIRHQVTISASGVTAVDILDVEVTCPTT